MTVVCHCLIGPPGSGKSTLAAMLVAHTPDLIIVSTDTIRKELYGDEYHQGSWPEVKAEVIRRANEAIASGRGVIYDATNVRRAWRLAIMAVMPRTDVYWLAWTLPTPREQCLAWNQGRDRPVPEAVVLDMCDAFDPKQVDCAEGFDYVSRVPGDVGHWDVPGMLSITPAKIARQIKARRNRAGTIESHRYSQLVDFERLMFVISLISNYPGIGSFDLKVTAETELAALLHQHYGEIYADPAAIAQDLRFLEAIELISRDREQDLVNIGDILAREQGQLGHVPDHWAAHRYSDRESMARLLSIIRFMAYSPLNGSTQEEVVEALSQEGLHLGRDAFRKDVEKVLRPYQILPPQTRAYKKGYFLGTGLLTTEELSKLWSRLQKLREEVAWQSFDPDNILNTFAERLAYSKILPEADIKQGLDVRRIGSRGIVDPKKVSHMSLLRRQDNLETAIRNGQCLRLVRLPHTGTFQKDAPHEHLEVYPLIIVFHNIGWYLGYQRRDTGLYAFTRMDRLVSESTLHHYRRSISDQKRAQAELLKLYDEGVSPYLGNDVTQQKAILRERSVSPSN
ncbi:MAG: ATP-binding protein, partial [Synechococcaceae cyanobacterium SM2_3_60]|nr:ATP-binding protein [Synechococcaceae cyanobacterium SM2_3_60]